MLSAWDTVWVCVGLTALMFGLDYVLGHRLAKKADKTRLASSRGARQKELVFTDLEGKQ